MNWPYELLEDFKTKPDSIYKNWQEYNNDIINLQKQAFSQGLLEFSIDSLTKIDSSNFQANVTIGKLYSWKSVKLDHKGIEIPKNISGKWEKNLVSL